MFDSLELEQKRARRPRWLKRLVVIAWGAWIIGTAIGGAGTFFVLCYAAAEALKAE